MGVTRPSAASAFHATLADLVRETAAEDASLVAAIEGEQQLTYGELVERVDDLAAVLRSFGIRDGDRIAHFGLPDIAYLISLLAADTVGAIWVGLNSKYSERELKHVINDSEPVLVVGAFATGEPTSALNAALVDVPLNGKVALTGACDGWKALSACDRKSGPGMSANRQPVAALVYTSGTTGAPKGALLRHDSLVHAGHIYNSQYPPQRAKRTRALCNLPINHVGCLCDITATTICAGGGIVFMPRFEPDRIAEEIDRNGITVVGQVPTMWRYILEATSFVAADLSSLEWAIWSGAPMPVDLARILRERGFQISNCYGMTETTGSITFTDPDDPVESITGTVGRPVEPENVRLWMNGSPKNVVGEPGEVQVRGPLLFAGYFKNDDATHQAFSDGEWFGTGDLAEWTEDGALRLVGRLKEMFKSGGYNVYPREIEEVLEAHPNVSAAAVVAYPHPVFEEVGCGFVIRAGDIEEAELAAWCKERLANYKVPKRFIVEDELPLLPIGKIDKSALKARLAAKREGA
jgi:acyl-CoA synthetase (AMP-forming)/AMP-acid ligase II